MFATTGTWPSTPTPRVKQRTMTKRTTTKAAGPPERSCSSGRMVVERRLSLEQRLPLAAVSWQLSRWTPYSSNNLDISAFMLCLRFGSPAWGIPIFRLLGGHVLSKSYRTLGFIASPPPHRVGGGSRPKIFGCRPPDISATSSMTFLPDTP